MGLSASRNAVIETAFVMSSRERCTVFCSRMCRAQFMEKRVEGRDERFSHYGSWSMWQIGDMGFRGLGLKWPIDRCCVLAGVL